MGGGNRLSSCNKGFTLAEVLVTLGIIGVVAAMTMPVLIANHKKNVTITRLQRAYNILSNVFVRAQVDYGDIQNWGLADNKGTVSEAESNKKLFDSFIRKYILPYLADGYSYSDDQTLGSLGYKNKILRRNGDGFMILTNKRQLIRLQDGTHIYPTFQTLTGEGPNGEKYLASIIFVVDIDGPKGKNVLGNDVFLMFIPFANNARLLFYDLAHFDSNNNFTLYERTREELLQYCEAKGDYCGRLIQSDGWQIKYKY